MAQQGTTELARNLKNRHVQLIALGGTIGTGLFLGSGQSIHSAGPSILLAYVIAGLACFLLMRALGEMLLSNLHYRSFIEAIRDYLGEKIAFVTGWTYWICWITIAMAEMTAIGTYIKLWFPSVPQWLPGLVVLIILLGVNLITVGAFGEVEFWFALIKIIAIIGLILVGIVLLLVRFKTPIGHASVMNLVNHGGFFATGIKGFLLSFQMVIFSFVGIEMVGMTSAETQDPETVIPKAINDIPMRIILFYVGALFIVMSIYPWNQLQTNQSPFVMVFKDIGIKGAASVINFVVITAAASACNSSLYTTGRMLAELTMGSKNPRIRRISRLSKHHVPANALILSTILISVSVLLNYFIPSQVFTLVSSVATVCFIFIWSIIILAHMKFKKTEKGRQSTFKTPLYPVGDYLILLFLMAVAVVLCMKHETLIALVLSIVWFVVLYGLRLRQKKVIN
ncbi:gamma-aminobutyrate permease related permease [Paucilactobacillus vaccinostercus DSM 20634]|jgi:AAT family amino acid transporter|uniref:Gamma-aminobutyrate permease related permease n=1 Tax=Paucilactobacillus vaccinostercus DSM 20634 TaxID=1423813 RepID=A0A0R2A016_9LACO|nr:amino acid permease [Paucilactobacillus vaccinostercus]KRM60295.1 gamma-aminobutyrate permease related permease [Paucilactobacillus vaccinostercus DSM 20634]RRG08639.1 MAG: amino acid permease [Lactobacillus sp.]